MQPRSKRPRGYRVAQVHGSVHGSGTGIDKMVIRHGMLLWRRLTIGPTLGDLANCP